MKITTQIRLSDESMEIDGFVEKEILYGYFECLKCLYEEVGDVSGSILKLSKYGPEKTIETDDNGVIVFNDFEREVSRYNVSITLIETKTN